MVLAGALLGACGSGGGGGDSQTGSGGPPDNGEKPDGSGRYFADPHQGGQASRLRVAEISWGRLVDVHDIDASTGAVDPTPVFRDWVINENVLSDGTRYSLETNPITQATRLIIHREEGAPSVGGSTFDSLLLAASRDLPPIQPKHDDGSSSGPFSLVARNACLVVRFDDLLDDSDTKALADQVRVLTGYAPSTPFAARVQFDANHGGIGFDGQFHSSRVLFDATISEADAAASGTGNPINTTGFPPSLTTESGPNLSLRLPTKVDFGSGLFSVLTNLQGGELATDANGPVDEGSPTKDLVRAMRAGNAQDQNNGFLVDLNAPEVLGAWPLTIESAAPDPGGIPGLDYILDIRFETGCAARPRAGDIVQVVDRFVEVTAPATDPQNGFVPDVRVRRLTSDSSGAGSLLGGASYLSTYDPLSLVEPACWFTFTPRPGIFPTGDISPLVQVSVRFSEPMDPASVLPFDTFLLSRGSSTSPPTARSLVVADVAPAADLKVFSHQPSLPLAHSGEGAEYHVELIGGERGVTDLAGNQLAAVPPFVDLAVDPNAPREANGGIVLRFNARDELEPERGYPDLRGQLFYDFEAGIIRPRPVVGRSVVADRSRPVPSIMIPFSPGVQTPLTPLGSKLQAVWRYADLGWVCDDETNFNLDVVGLSWAPIGGTIVADFYDEFEIALGHSNRLPDEALTSNLLPILPASGLLPPPAFFTDNVLIDQRDPSASQVVVHPRTLGYVVDPTTVFQSETGTVLVPYPLSQGGRSPVPYTWRDTAITTVGGVGSAGIPMNIETLPPLLLDPRPAGSVAPPGEVPSFGLPLLMEFRCFPNETGIGLNPLDISLAVNSSARPNFRAFSTGGFNSAGERVRVDPDLSFSPSGGFNPNMAGAPTPGVDNSFYVGQLDVVTRVSRVHTIFLDTLLGRPDFFTPRLEPREADQPSATAVVLEHRGATGFGAETGDAGFDAGRIDPYGEPRDDVDLDGVPENLTVHYLNDDPTWKSSVDEVDGARYLQLRITFLNNVAGGTSPSLSAIGIAFAEAP